MRRPSRSPAWRRSLIQKWSLKDVDGTHYTFVAKVTVKPEVTLGEYKGLKAERESDKVTDADVETEPERHGRSQCPHGRSPRGR